MNEIVKVNQLDNYKIEIDMQIATAKQYPRNEEVVISKVKKLATLNKDIAAECFYSKPVGDGKVVVGESIRFAEIVYACWQNLRIKTYLKEESPKSITVVAEGIDNETNTAISTEVSRSIWGKYGRYSDAQIEVVKLAAQAIARRNIIFQLVPKGYFSETLEYIRGFSSGKFEAVSKDAHNNAVEKTLKAFKKYNIEQETIFKKVGIKSIDEITPDILADLIGFGTALKEGIAPSEIFWEDANNVENKPIELKPENLFKDENN